MENDKKMTQDGSEYESSEYGRTTEDRGMNMPDNKRYSYGTSTEPHPDRKRYSYGTSTEPYPDRKQSNETYDGQYGNRQDPYREQDGRYQNNKDGYGNRHYEEDRYYGNGQGHSDDRNRRYQGEPYEYNQYNGRQYDNRPYGTGNYPEGPGGYGNDRPPQDKRSFGWAVLGFFLPLVGLILFFVWKKEKPGNAKKAGLGALIGGILCVVVLLIDAFTIGRVAKKYIAENGETTSSSTFVANASSGTEEPDVISSSVYSEKYGTTDDSAADMPAVTKMPEQQEMIDSTSMNDTEGPRYADIQAAPENGTADWKTFAFTLDGKDMSLPVAYSDLQAAGWSVDLSEYGYEDGYIMNANDAVSVSLTNDKYDLTAVAGFANLTDSAQDITKCDVISLTLDAEFSDSNPDIKLPGDLTWGSSLDDVLAAYGKPYETYYSDTLQYYELTYKTDDYQYLQLVVYDDGGIESVYMNMVTRTAIS